MSANLLHLTIDLHLRIIFRDEVKALGSLHCYQKRGIEKATKQWKTVDNP